ncbi:MAG TPA: hypothetical protein VGN09_16460 [Vicinamibacteria bacterium]|jgi:hypothetical protein
MNAKALVTVLGALAMVGCTPDWAKNGDALVVLLMTSINDGAPLDSDIRISNGNVCPDTVSLRLENHFKNPNVTATGFRHDFTVERYEVRYFRSDGRNTEGVDVPYRISGNVAQEIVEEQAATMTLEVVRRQAKLEPPLANISGANPPVVTMFAEVTLHARTTTGTTTNPVSARLQIDFADFADNLVECPTTAR